MSAERIGTAHTFLTMTQSRPVLPREYRLSDLRVLLDIDSVPEDNRTLHTLFAVVMNDIDRRADIHQSIKPEILEGLAQAWLSFAENEEGVDVLVEQDQRGVSTSVDDPAEERSVSSKAQLSVGESRFDETLREKPDHDVTLASFERDMRRLDDLRRMYAYPGLNTAESREAAELREKYALEHREWWQRQYLSEKKEATDGATISPSSASISH